MITHRMSLAEAADQVVMLEGGSIIEQGSPAELLGRPGALSRQFTLARLTPRKVLQ